MSTVVDETSLSQANTVGDYVPAPLMVFKVAPEFDVDLFMLADDSCEPTLFRSREYEINKGDLERLEKKGTSRLYVRLSDYDRYLKQLRRQIGDIVTHASLSPADRLTILRTAVASEVEHAFKLIDTGKAVTLAEDMGGYLIEALEGGETSATALFQVMQHDYQTFNHLVNVASFCLILASRMGVADKAELQEIAVGGMLHDIGKRHIPREVLNKAGPLTPREREVVKKHPTTGYIDLHDKPGVTFRQLMMVYQHHERLNGKGYPVGVTARDIEFGGRLCAVVDVFEALTAHRPYRAALSVEEALEYLRDNAETQFDKDMVQCWSSAILSK